MSVGDRHQGLATLTEVPVEALPPERFGSVVEPSAYEVFADSMERLAGALSGNTIWNVNSTGEGGGVAEMLGALLPYLRGAGTDARWLVIEGNEDFFATTKRLHNRLHGAEGDEGALGSKEREVYDAVIDRNAAEFTRLVRPGDVVLVHDPQTAGLIAPLKDAGAHVVWQCHVGVDEPNDPAREAWGFLTPSVEPADLYVFSRSTYLWDGLDKDRLRVVAPSIDAFALKNQDVDPPTVEAILVSAGVIDGSTFASPTVEAADGSIYRFEGSVRAHGDVPPPPAGARLVVQVSRWDALKDPVGVMRAFARGFDEAPDVHLILAGPSVEEVADDPEGREVFEGCSEVWDRAPAHLRSRMHLLWMPLDDLLVNALQRRADVVVQKSLVEGFGLTVSEAMWKERPVVGSRVGGIQDQIVHGETGVLIDDPRDAEGTGDALRSMIAEPDAAAEMGRRGKQRVAREFLAPRQLIRYGDLIGNLVRAS